MTSPQAQAIAEMLANRYFEAQASSISWNRLIVTHSELVTLLASAATLGIDVGATGLVTANEPAPPASNICPACETTTYWCRYCGAPCSEGCVDDGSHPCDEPAVGAP